MFTIPITMFLMHFRKYFNIMYVHRYQSRVFLMWFIRSAHAEIIAQASPFMYIGGIHPYKFSFSCMTRIEDEEMFPRIMPSFN